MWQQDWATAATHTEAIITNDNYGLVASTQEVFEGDLNHDETLWAVVYADGEIGGGNRNQIHFNLVARYDRIPGAQFSLENGNRSAGFLLLNDYLRNLLREDPNDTRDDNTYYITHYTYNDPSDLPDGVSLGDTIRLYDQYSEDQDERMLYYERLNPGCLKFRDESAAADDASGISNIMLYRLAETYLIAAEANMELGNTTEALAYLNEVRTRAKAAPVATIDIETVLEERARELAFEGQRWFTLKRRGLLIAYLQDHAGNDNFRDIIRERVEPRHVNFPIAREELELLGPDYPQNEGY